MMVLRLRILVSLRAEMGQVGGQVRRTLFAK